MNIARVVVDTDGNEGPVSEELEPIAKELSGDEEAEPGGEFLTLSDYRGDIGETCETQIIRE